MELNYDWRGFQTVFHPYRRRDGGASSGVGATRDGHEVAAALSPAPIFAVTEAGKVLAASIEDEDPTPWIGQPLSRLVTELPGRDLILFEREEVDRWMGATLSLPHFFEQAESLRGLVEPRLLSARTGGLLKPPSPVKMKKGALDELTQRHFLLDAIPGWWRKVMPRAYGLFLQLDPPKAATSRSGGPLEAKLLFLLVRRGRIELFHEPDLAGMGPLGPGTSRQRQTAAIVKYLSEKHLVRVQGLVAREEDWTEWSDPANRHKAWRMLAMAVRARRAKLVPFRWPVLGLMASRGIFGI